MNFKLNNNINVFRYYKKNVTSKMRKKRKQENKSVKHKNQNINVNKKK